MRAIALEYHDVLASGDADASGFAGASAASYKLTVPQFEAQLSAFEAAGIHIMSAKALLEVPIAVTPVLLTFDDGGVSALTHVRPCLDRHHWTGHFLITTERIGSIAFLDPTQVRTLHEAGHIVGSHSCTHPMRFSTLPRREMSRQWAESKTALEQILGAPVIAGSIPGGHYRRAAAETAAEAGYRILFTSEPIHSVRTVDGCLVVGRYSIRRSTTACDATALAIARLRASGRQWVVWNIKKAVKTVGGRAYLAFRERIFEHHA